MTGTWMETPLCCLVGVRGHRSPKEEPLGPSCPLWGGSSEEDKLRCCFGFSVTAAVFGELDLKIYSDLEFSESYFRLTIQQVMFWNINPLPAFLLLQFTRSPHTSFCQKEHAAPWAVMLCVIPAIPVPFLSGVLSRALSPGQLQSHTGGMLQTGAAPTSLLCIGTGARCCSVPGAQTQQKQPCRNS